MVWMVWWGVVWCGVVRCGVVVVAKPFLLMFLLMNLVLLLCGVAIMFGAP